MILYVAIGALFAFLGGMVYYSTLDFPELEKSELELISVDVVEINSIENRMFLKVIFFPILLSEAIRYSSLNSKFSFSITSKSFLPTFPVAPTIAIFI